MSDLALQPSAHSVTSARGTSLKMSRPIECMRALGVPASMFSPTPPQAFEIARRNWTDGVRAARAAADVRTERLLNLAWQVLKAWRCPHCQCRKNRAGDITCSRPACRSLQASTSRRINQTELKAKFYGLRWQNKMDELDAVVALRICKAFAANPGNHSAVARELRLNRMKLRRWINILRDHLPLHMMEPARTGRPKTICAQPAAGVEVAA